MAISAQHVSTLLDPRNCVVVLIDYQPQMAFGVTSIDGQILINNPRRPHVGGGRDGIDVGSTSTLDGLGAARFTLVSGARCRSGRARDAAPR